MAALEQHLNAEVSVLRDSVQPILAYAQRELKDFTIHGELHSENVEKILTDIISRCNTQVGPCNINPYEKYILICCAWLHDIGVVLGREEHNSKTCSIIDKLYPAFLEGLDSKFVEFVKIVCLYHSKKMQIQQVPVQSPFSGTFIRLQYLTAILRIADAADMDNKRAPIGVFEIIKEKLTKKSQKIWRSHQAVRDVSFLPEGNSIIITVKDKRTSLHAVNDFKLEFSLVSAILEKYDFPFTQIAVVRENRAIYRGQHRLS